MKYIEVIADVGNADTVRAISEKAGARDFQLGIEREDGKQLMKMLVDDSNLQDTIDTLQNILSAQSTAQILVLPIETYLPKSKDKDKNDSESVTRESLYKEVEKGVQLDSNYFLLVILATTVAAIGLIENNIAVVIGAMVIAPLLGPNLALSFGAALGDTNLIQKAAKALSLGVLLSVLMSIIIGYLWPMEVHSYELLLRTNANIDSVALALASGAAATLSLTTGLSSVLVGVMVSVALLPPAVTLGIMLGDGSYQLASGAALLLAINIVCVNIASKLVFYFKGVNPRTWHEKEKAKKAMTLYIAGWFTTLIVLLILIYLRKSM